MTRETVLTRKVPLGIVLAWTLSGQMTLAQTTALQTTSNVSNHVPVALTPGAPAGSYALNGFENVNLYSGTLNFNMPLLEIGGRGKVNFTITLPISRPPWLMQTSTSKVCYNQQQQLACNTVWNSSPYPDWYRPYLAPHRYGPGLVLIRRSSNQPIDCQYQSAQPDLRYQQTFSYLVYVKPDGSEIPLYDAPRHGLWNWVPASGGSCPSEARKGVPGQTVDLAVGRGSLFTAADGSGISFLFDTVGGGPGRWTVSDLNDQASLGTVTAGEFVTAGQLKFPDGTVYSVVDGKVTSMRDVYGNKISFEYRVEGGLETTAVERIRDPLGRVVDIQYNVSDAQCASCDHIIFKGSAGVERRIRIKRESDVRYSLRQDYLPNYGGGSPEPSSIRQHIAQGAQNVPNPVPFSEQDNSALSLFSIPVISRVILPDLRSYEFFYNPYAELARVALPTGGDIEFDYWSGIEANANKGAFASGWILSDLEGLGVAEAPGYSEQQPAPPWKPLIYRRIRERRSYDRYGAGRSVQSTTNYARAESLDPNSPGAVAGITPARFSSVLVNWSGSADVSESGAGVANARTTKHYFYNRPSTREGYQGPYTSADGGPLNELLKDAVVPSASGIVAYPDPFDGKEFKTESGLGSGTPKVRTERTWYVPTNNDGSAQVCHENTTLDGSATSTILRSHDAFDNVIDEVEHDYDKSIPSIWASSAPSGWPSRNVNLCPQAGAPGSPQNHANIGQYARRKHFDYVTDTNYVSVEGAHLQGLVTRSLVCGTGNCDASNFAAKTERFYDVTPTGSACGAMNAPIERGAIPNWVSPGSNPRGSLSCELTFTDAANSLRSNFEYDSLGNVVKKTERGSALNIAIAPGCGSYSNSYAFVQTVSNGLGHSASYTYDCDTGKVKTVVDPNQVRTTLTYESAVNKLDRLEMVKEGEIVSGGGRVRETKFEYSAASVTPPTLTVKTDAKAYQDSLIESGVFYDGYGREVKSESRDGGTSVIQTLTEYDGLGRVSRKSNPHFSSGLAEWTYTRYDDADRVYEVEAPGGAKTVTSYAGAQRTVAEPKPSGYAGRTRRLTSDGLGRLKTVEELGTEDAQASTYATSYQYSALDKLVRVDQGVQRRCFVYDKGGRLTGAWNPEAGGSALCDPASAPGAGWMRWEFDGLGNPTKQIWPSGKWKELHNYDALNRARGIRYSDVGSANATRPVTMVFDSCALGVGRLCGTENGYSNEALSYDSGGAIVGSTQSTLVTGTTNLTNYAFSYEYWANGVRKKMVYPSGREVEYDQDRRGRVVSAKGRAAAGGAQFDYVTAQSYHPHGALASVALGNGLTEEHCYNGRLQMTAMRLGTGGVGNCALAASDWWRMGLEYGGTASANNGNVAEQTITARLDAGGHWTRKQVFSYDGVNRLKRVEEQQVSGGSATSWAVDFGYDRYGNQWVPSATTNVSAPRATKMGDYEAATNRIVKYWNDTTVPVGAYDGDGNWKDWLDVGVLTYDGENRVTKVVGTGGTATFEYDGQGRRVRKTAGGVETTFVYDADGEVAAEYGGASTLVGRHFVTADHLGSTRVLTNVSGGRVHCADYLPFGEEIRTGTALSVRAGVGCYGTGGMERKFTGKERDAETGLDYFGARYLSSAQGRFASADPYVFQFAAASHTRDEGQQNQLRDRYISNPQVWNKYAYGLNNPLKFIDPTGKCSKPSGQKEGETGICIEAFIAKSWFKLVGRGDGRTFSGTDSSQTARSRIKLTVDGKGNVTSQNVESARSGVLVKGMGLQGDTVAKVESKGNQDGSVSLHVSLWGRNGEAGIPGAPKGVLEGNFNFNISKDGSVTLLNQGSSATTFPSWGIYGYGPNGGVQTVKEIPENKIEDLQKPPAPIK